MCGVCVCMWWYMCGVWLSEGAIVFLIVMYTTGVKAAAYLGG